MSLIRKDVLQMNRIELSALLDRKSIHHDDGTNINEMRQRYLNYMNETCSEFVEDGAMSTEKEESELSMIEISEFLEKNEIPFENVETFKEMKDLYDMHKKSSKPSKELGQSNLAVMEEIIEKDQKKRAELVEIYDMLIAFFEAKNKDLDQIKSILESTCPKFEGTLAANKDKLCTNECPIVIAGETSAGKSTLLNLLLGTEILPHSLLGTTASVCHLHNSSEKRFDIHLDNNDIVTVKADSDEEMKDLLKPYVTAREEQTQSKYTKVDVYWPIPMLHEHVTVVDTPGIGENDQLTNVLLTYLPNAVAFIYVINAPNSGGIQDDYLLRILQHQAEWSSNDLLQNAIDYKSTIFVCNKWDKVEKANEEERVWDHITNSLTNLLPNFPKENILKMSATLAQRNRKNGLKLTPGHEAFLRCIEKLTAQSMTAKTRKYCMWIRIFLKNVQSTLLSRINNAEKNKHDKEKLRTDVLDRLDILGKHAEEVKSKLLKSAQHECVDIANNLLKYVQCEHVKESILSWDDRDIPDEQFNDFKLTKYMAEKSIRSRLNNVLMCWERQNRIMEHATDRLRSKLISECKLLTTESERIAAVIEGSDESTIEEEESTIDLQEDFKISVAYKAAIAVTSPIWVPLAVAATILILPVAIAKVVGESMLDRNQLASFRRNKAKYMREWTKKIIDSTFTKASIDDYVNKVFFNAYKKEINKFFTYFIPNQIEMDEKWVTNICDDERTSQDILKEFNSLHKKVKLIQAKLQMHELVDLKHHDMSALELIVGGSFYDIYKARWANTDHVEEDVVVKVVSKKLDEYSFLERLDELSLMKKIQHVNIVKVHDICCWTHDDNVKKLVIVQDLCDGNLEDIVFKNEKLQSCKFGDSERDEAFSFYLKMAIGVCDGLAKIHQHEYLHGDLKLSNVLVKNETAKLCGHYFTKSKAPPIEKFAETRQPEQRTSDKFKLGILLWELWYGRHAYSVVGRTSSTMEESPEIGGTGVCLKFTDNYSPPDELQALIRQCCIHDAPQLSTAYDMSCKLMKLVKE